MCLDYKLHEGKDQVCFSLDRVLLNELIISLIYFQLLFVSSKVIPRNYQGIVMFLLFQFTLYLSILVSLIYVDVLTLAILN